MNRRGFMKNSAIVAAFPVSFLENSFKERSLKDSTFVLMRFERKNEETKFYDSLGLGKYSGMRSFNFCGGESELSEILNIYKKYGSYSPCDRNAKNEYYSLGNNEKISCECMYERSRNSGYFSYQQLLDYCDDSARE